MGAANSVDARFGILAVAVEAEPKQDDGWVAFYSTLTLELLTVVPAGALPDMVTFSQSGRYVLAANEGEPDSSYTDDPEGTVTIIDMLRFGQPDFTKTVQFGDFNEGGTRHGELPADVRIYGPGRHRRAGPRARVHHDRWRHRLGHAPGKQRDRRDRHPHGARQEGLRARLQGSLQGRATSSTRATTTARSASAAGPCSACTSRTRSRNFRSGDKHYLITVNEGDTRDYDAFSEEERVADLTLDPAAFPNAADAAAGREPRTPDGDECAGRHRLDGDFDRLYVPGGRSFSIWNARTGALVFDSGAELEQLLANLLPDEFNANHEENDSFDNRSDNKGPEPEGVTLGIVQGTLYAFVGLERIGGIVVLDLTDPTKPGVRRLRTTIASSATPPANRCRPAPSSTRRTRTTSAIASSRIPRPATSAPRASSSCRRTMRRAASRS